MKKNIAIGLLAVLCLFLTAVIVIGACCIAQIQKSFQGSKEGIVRILKEDDIIFTGVGIPDKLLSTDEGTNIKMAQKHLAERYYDLRVFDRSVKVAEHTVFVFRCPAVEEIEDNRLAKNEFLPK